MGQPFSTNRPLSTTLIIAALEREKGPLDTTQLCALTRYSPGAVGHSANRLADQGVLLKIRGKGSRSTVWVLRPKAK
jgi:hypothetical protein